MALTKIDDRGLNTPIDLLDDEKIRLGTGNDLELYHDGSNSYLGNATGDIIIENSGTNTSNQIYIRGKTGENSITAHGNGQVEVYYDDSKKLETTSYGAKFHSSAPAMVGIHSTDGGNTSEARIALGALSTNSPEQRGVQVVAYNMNAGHHMDLRTSSTHSAGPTTKMRIQNDGNIVIPNDNGKLGFGAGNDLQIYHDGSHSRIVDSGTGNLMLQSDRLVIADAGNSENMLVCQSDAGVELYYNNSKKFETTTNGAEFFGNFDGADSQQIRLGAGQDLKLYHNGTNSFIENDTGELFISASQVNIKSAAGEYMAYFNDNGEAALYYDDVKRFETNSSGAHCTGSLTADTVAVQDNEKFLAGNSDDLQIWHDGSDSIMKWTTGKLIFRRSDDTAGMGITGSGNIVLGGDVTHVNGSVSIDPAGDSGGAVMTWNRADTTGWTTALRFWNNTGAKGYIRYDDSSVQYYSASDYRLKENDVVIADGITKVKQLRPIRFNWKGHSDTVEGFFAHEVQNVVPAAVIGEKDSTIGSRGEGYQMMSNEPLIPLLTAALKDAISKIEILETKVAALEAA